MMRSVCAVLFAALLLPAQTIDTLGGTTTAPSGALRGKGSLFAVTTSVLMTEYEMHMSIPGPETLTWFIFRHHSRTGVASLVWTQQTQVAGGGGPQWYSTGPIAFPLVAGNHYVLGAFWQGTLTYYYTTSSQPTPVSFGSWQRAHTLTGSLPTTLTLPAGIDSAVYYQRITTIPVPAVVNTGTSCSATALLPRLVAADFFRTNTTTALELVDSLPWAITLFGFTGGPAVGTPLPLFNCNLWLDLSTPPVTLASLASATGYSALPLPVPNDPLLIGSSYSSQGLVFGASTVDVTNAVSFTIQ